MPSKEKQGVQSGLPCPCPCFAPLACNFSAQQVWISFGVFGSFLIVMCSRHAAPALCSHPSFLSLMLTALSLHLFMVSALKACRTPLFGQSVHEVLIAIYKVITERVLGRTYALQAYPEYWASFLALSSSRPGPGRARLPSPALSASADPRPPKVPHLSFSSLSLSLSLLYTVSRLRVTCLPESCHGSCCFAGVMFSW
jgi:hypothetical protein